MSLADIRELLQSLCLILHGVLILRITLKIYKFVELFGLISKGNEIISEQWKNIYDGFEIIGKRLEKLEKNEKK